MTGGERYDCTQAQALLDGLRTQAVLADKGYDTDEIVRIVQQTGALVVIPPRSNRTVLRDYDKVLYKEAIWWNECLGTSSISVGWRPGMTKQRSRSCRSSNSRPATYGSSKCRHDLDHNNDFYLLSVGKRFCVTKDFVKEVNGAYNRIPEFVHQLPEYDDQSEGEYNKRVAKSFPNAFALMDCRIIPYGGGHGKFEFCDLYSKDRDIIHVKRYANSSVRSHLFSQGLGAGELFQTVTEFRKKVNGFLPTKSRLSDAKLRPKAGRYQVVFAIVSDVPGNWCFHSFPGSI